MPTTSYQASTFSANVIGARTDSSGSAVTDLSAEEARLPNTFLLLPGYLTSTAFQVTQQASPNMTVKIGSGTAKADLYAVSYTATGQGNYIVRLDVTSQNVTISAADASQTRTDEIYLVVRDNLYDSSGFALPEFGYRKGDLGGANPGPDASWKAYNLLARITVAAGVTSIVTANISDQRTAGGVTVPAVQTTTATTATLAASGAVTAASVTTTGAVTAGTNVVGTSDVKVGSTSLPRGLVAWCYRNSSTPINNATAAASACETMLLSCSMTAGRRYRIECPAIIGSSQTAGVNMIVQLTYTTDGSTPHANSTRLVFTESYMGTAFYNYGLGSLAADYTPSGNITFKALLSYYTVPQAYSAIVASSDAIQSLVISDLGVDPGASGTNLV